MPSKQGLISRDRSDLDHAEFYERAVEAALPFGRDGKIGIAAMLKKAGARNINLIKRQPRLLQNNRTRKGKPLTKPVAQK